jgi:GTP-binding protein
MFRKSFSFITSAYSPQAFIPEIFPEITFWGRSNVGKSSLLNALMGARNLARTSKTPGRTQAVQFYRMSDGMILTDLPGYGYAAVPFSVSKQWKELVSTYLSSRACLWRVYLILDSRRSLQPTDCEAIDFLNRIQKPYSFVLSKIDRLSESFLLEQQEVFRHQFPGVPLWAVSAKNKRGIDHLREDLFGPLKRKASL